MQNDQLLHTQRALIESRNELHAIYDSTPFMMCVVGPDRKVLSANRVFSKTTGWSSSSALYVSDVIGNMLRCIHASSSANGCGAGSICGSCVLRQALIDTFEHGRTIEDVEHHTTLVRNGRPAGYWYLCTTARIEAPDGFRVLLSLVDVTERKQAEADRRNTARHILDNEEGLKKKLAAELHDEIGRDLTALGINLALIHEGQADDVSEKLLTRIDDSSKLVKAIGHSARNIMGSLRPPGLDDLGLVASLGHHVALFSQRTGITVSLEVQDTFPKLAADREMALFRIVQESLTNISKYADASSVQIRLQDEHGWIRLTVSDDGNGLSPALLPTIQTASGLGLKTMRERAEMIGGTFRLDSLAGKGTTVSVQIEDCSNAG